MLYHVERFSAWDQKKTKGEEMWVNLRKTVEWTATGAGQSGMKGVGRKTKFKQKLVRAGTPKSADEWCFSIVSVVVHTELEVATAISTTEVLLQVGAIGHEIIEPAAVTFGVSSLRTR